MVRRYKDIGRIRTAQPGSVNYNINVPTNTGANELYKSLQQTSNQVNQVFFDIAKQEAVKRAKEDESKSAINIVDGVPEFSPTDAGGTIYNQAYNDAAKVSYANALENSIEAKITDIKTRYFNNPELRTDTNNLIGMLNTELQPMRNKVSDQFKKTFDIFASNKTQSLIQTDLKENANRARTNLSNSTEHAIEKTINSMYSITDEGQFEDAITSVKELIATKKKISPNLVTDFYIEDITKQITAIRKWQPITIALNSKNQEGEYLFTSDDVQDLNDAIGALQESVEINGVTFDLKDIHNSTTAQAQISNYLTKISNARNKDDTNYAETSIQINNELIGFNDKIAEIYQNDGTPEEYEDAYKVFDKAIKDISAEATSEKITLSIQSTKSSALASASSLRNRYLSSLHKEKKQVIDSNIEKDLTANLRNKAVITELIQNNANRFKNDSNFLALKKFVETSGNIEKLNNFLNTLEKSGNKSVITDISNLIKGDKTIDDEKYFGLEQKDIYNTFSPIRNYIQNHLEDMATKSSSLSKEQIDFINITNDLKSKDQDSVVPYSTSTSRQNEYFFQGIMNGNASEDLEAKVALTIQYLQKGYRPTKLGSMIESNLAKGNNDFIMQYALPLIKQLEGKNIDIANINLSAEAFGLLSSIKEMDMQSADFDNVLANVRKYLTDEGLKDMAQLNIINVLDMATASNLSDKDRYVEIFNNLYNAVAPQISSGKDIQVTRRGVQYAINEHMLQKVTTGQNTITNRKGLIKRTKEIISSLSEDRLSVKESYDYGAPSHLFSENPIVSSNIIRKSTSEHPYHNMVDMYRRYVGFFNLNTTTEGALTAISIANQIQEKGGITSMDGLVSSDISWGKEIKGAYSIPAFSRLITIGRAQEMADKLGVNTYKGAFKIEPVAGDVITGLKKQTNLIDLFSLKTIEGNDIPMMLGKNLYFANSKDKDLDDNQRVAMLRVETDQGTVVLPIMDKNNEPLVIDLPKNYNVMLDKLNKNIYLNKKIIDGKKAVFEAMNPQASGIEQGLSTIPQPKIANLDSLDIDKKENNIVNFTRSKYTYDLLRADVTEYTDTYIKESNNKYYVYPSTGLKYVREKQGIEYVNIGKDDAFNEYNGTQYMLEYNSKEEALEAKKYIEDQKTKDKNIMSQ